MKRKPKVRRYRNFYGSSKQKKEKVLIVQVVKYVAVFLVLAVIFYFVAVGVSSYFRRQHCTSVNVDDIPDYDDEKGRELPEQNRGGVVSKKLRNFTALELDSSRLNDLKYVKDFVLKAKKNEKTAVIIPVKEENGVLTYSSEIEKAREWRTISNKPANLKKIVSEIEKEGLFAIARICAFLDFKAPEVSRENGFVENSRKAATFVFKDEETNEQQKWLNLFQFAARRYICDVVSEVSELGCEMVILDNACFPPFELSSKVKMDDFDCSKEEVYKDFLAELSERGVPYIISLNFGDFRNRDLQNLKYGGNILNYGIKNYAPIIKLKKDLDEFENFIENFEDGDVCFVPTIGFGEKNSEEAVKRLKKIGILSSISSN